MKWWGIVLIAGIITGGIILLFDFLDPFQGLKHERMLNILTIFLLITGLTTTLIKIDKNMKNKQ